MGCRLQTAGQIRPAGLRYSASATHQPERRDSLGRRQRDFQRHPAAVRSADEHELCRGSSQDVGNAVGQNGLGDSKTCALIYSPRSAVTSLYKRSSHSKAGMKTVGMKANMSAGNLLKLSWKMAK